MSLFTIHLQSISDDQNNNNNNDDDDDDNNNNKEKIQFNHKYVLLCHTVLNNVT